MRNENFNWIILGYHADNGNNLEKWDKNNAVMNDLNDAYKWPKLLYIDVNTDVEHKKFKEWEATLENRKWQIYKSNNWTRRGKGKQKNTNIDVILTYDIPPDIIKVRVGEQIEKISDHKPIVVELQDKRFTMENTSKKDEVIDRGLLR